MGVKTPFANATEAGFEPGKLAEFLLEQKETFLEDLRRGRRGNWTIAMGNEAGGEPKADVQGNRHLFLT
jgi:hypothetical protein